MAPAKWLLHGHEQRRDDVVDDAVALLDALVDGLGDSAARLDPVAVVGVDDAMAVLADTPVTKASAEDDGSIAMQTDAYDPEMVSLFVAAAREHEPNERDTSSGGEPAKRSSSLGEPSAVPVTDMETAPIDVSSWSELRQASGSGAAADPAISDDTDADTSDPADPDEEIEAARASRAAFQRWARSASE